MQQDKQVDMLKLREALEASWDEKTVYEGIMEEGNPAFGQCYPTSWVVQFFFPDTEILKGIVWTGTSEEVHFWNALTVGGVLYHIDLSWQQFPHGSIVRNYEVLDRSNLRDGEEGKRRCNLLKDRVVAYLQE